MLSLNLAMKPGNLHPRLLFVVTGLAFGGAETQVMHLATRLSRRGWNVTVISIMPPVAYEEELSNAGVRVLTLGIGKKRPDPKPLLKMARVIRQWQPHIIHSHMVHANILARLARLFAPIPVLICTAHSIDERGRKGSGRLRTFFYRITDPLCDLTTQVSHAGLERYIRIRAVPKHKIKYIPNGVDTGHFSPNLETRGRVRSSLGLDSEFVWLTVGRFDLAKDYPTLLFAFAQVVKTYPNTSLVIAGDGPLRPAMEILAKELGIGNRVCFLGIRRDIPELMNAADGYVMSSAWEGMPLVLLEAHASGLPIVATNVGGNGEIVLHNKTGFLVSPKNPTALADAMVRLMELPPQERQDMGQIGRKHIIENFSLDRVVEMWEALYFELLRRKGIQIA